MVEELMLNEGAFAGSQDDYDAINEAIKKLSTASQDQFESIKKEKWYNRVFDMVTFSKKKEKRLAEQVGTIAQAQQIFIELLLRLSANDATISRIILESKNDICKLSEQNIFLLEKIKQLENISLGIKADMDINKLSEREKSVLSACLYMINDKNEEASEEQKIFANSVLRYLDIDVQMENPVNAFGSMENNAKRRILSCCMEYIFLQNCSGDSYDKYEDFIEEFDLGNKTIRSIERQIEAIYKLRGANGFYSKYEADNYAEIGDLFSCDFDDIEDSSDVNIEMSDEIISSLVLIRPGETKSYKNKNIHLKADISCDGSLEIENCVLYYNEFDSNHKISLEKNSELLIKNTIIICKGYSEQMFISCGVNNSVLIESTTFIDCSYFIEVNYDCTFQMMKCEIKNGYGDFISIKEGKSSCVIADNIIIQEELNDFYKNDIGRFPTPKLIYIAPDMEKVQFVNNIIKESADFKKISDGEILCYFDGHNAEIINCSFKGMSVPIYANKVKDCKFEDCTRSIYLMDGSFFHKKDALVDNCIFKNCTKVIFNHTCYHGRSIITNCQFISCYDELLSSDSAGGLEIEFCEFINIKNLTKNNKLMDLLNRFVSCINFQRSGADAMENSIKKCVFDGIEIGDGFLVQASGYEEPRGAVSYIEKCDFKNCTTERSSGKIIKEYMQYDTLFKKNVDFHANRISDCCGLDKINKEDSKADHFEERTVSTSGNCIGAVLDTEKVGAPRSLNRGRGLFTGIFSALFGYDKIF